MKTEPRVIARILDAEWKKLSLWCSNRRRQACVVKDRSTACGEHACYRLAAIRHDMETTERQCYRDKNGFRVYVERFAHNRRPWFIWHEEPCAFPPGARSVGGDVTLKGAQAKLDRMAARYGWEPCEMPDFVRDEEG